MGMPVPAFGPSLAPLMCHFTRGARQSRGLAREQQATVDRLLRNANCHKREAWPKGLAQREAFGLVEGPLAQQRPGAPRLQPKISPTAAAPGPRLGGRTALLATTREPLGVQLGDLGCARTPTSGACAHVQPAQHVEDVRREFVCRHLGPQTASSRTRANFTIVAISCVGRRQRAVDDHSWPN